MKQTFKRFVNFIKKHKWSSLVVLIAILVASVIIWDSFSANSNFNPTDITIKKKQKEEKVRAPISGRLIDEERAKRKPIAVVIENHPDSRPQSGLNQASMIIETFAEGGITRFLAFFQEEDVAEIGPVRSARPYFVDWAHSYNALFAHVGGNSDALSMIQTLKVLDLNQFNFGNYFWRDSKRAAPHNVYSTTEKLLAAAKSKKYPTTDENIPAFSFKDDAKPEERPADFTFRVNFNANFAVSYYYSKTENIFLRSIAGAKHTDRAGEQIKAKNVVVGFSDFAPGTSTAGEQMTKIRTTGSGKAIFYVDGNKSEGTWKRDNGKIMRFYTTAGEELKLNGGTTWVEFVPTGTVVN